MAMQYPPGLLQGILKSSNDLGIDPAHLAAAISYETGGTFDPDKLGPKTQWGQHRGLIQFGEPQAKQYGYTPGMPADQQMEAVTRYMKDRGLKPGMGLMDVYSVINAGGPGKYNASDRPGMNVASHVAAMGPHLVKAQGLLSSDPNYKPGPVDDVIPQNMGPASAGAIDSAPLLPPDVQGPQMPPSLLGPLHPLPAAEGTGATVAPRVPYQPASGSASTPQPAGPAGAAPEAAPATDTQKGLDTITKAFGGGDKAATGANQLDLSIRSNLPAYEAADQARMQNAQALMQTVLGKRMRPRGLLG